LKIEHQFSDPPPDVRRELKVRQENDIRAFGKKVTEPQIQSQIRESHAIRERYWLDQLLSLGTWPVLFICGADHTDSFALLLQENGFDVLVAFSDWP